LILSFSLLAKDPVRMVYHKSLSGTLNEDIKDHVTKAYSSIGESIVFIYRPVGRGKLAFKKKIIDADLARQDSTYTTGNALFVPNSLIELTVRKYCLFYYCDSALEKKKKDLIGVTISGGVFLTKIDPDLNVVLVESKLQLIKMLLFGRADYIIAPFGPEGLMSKLLRPRGEPLFKMKIYHWLQNSHKHLAPKLDEYFKKNPMPVIMRDDFDKKMIKKNKLKKIY
jgi:hypothetical protein